MGTSVVFLEKVLGFAIALGFLIVFITPGGGLAFDVSADFGAAAGSCPGFGADFAIAFALGRGGADFFLGGPKDSATPWGFGKESFCIDFPQPLPFGGGTDAGPSIPSGCFCAGDLVFGPTGFDLCRSLAIVLTFVGGGGS